MKLLLFGIESLAQVTDIYGGSIAQAVLPLHLPWLHPGDPFAEGSRAMELELTSRGQSVGFLGVEASVTWHLPDAPSFRPRADSPECSLRS